jgi:hypothetical protein
MITSHNIIAIEALIQQLVAMAKDLEAEPRITRHIQLLGELLEKGHV